MLRQIVSYAGRVPKTVGSPAFRRELWAAAREYEQRVCGPGAKECAESGNAEPHPIDRNENLPLR